MRAKSTGNHARSSSGLSIPNGVRYKANPDRSSGIEINTIAATLFEKCTAIAGPNDPDRAVRSAISMPNTPAHSAMRNAFSPAWSGR
mgnify:CR=1 FL=1